MAIFLFHIRTDDDAERTAFGSLRPRRGRRLFCFVFFFQTRIFKHKGLLPDERGRRRITLETLHL